MKAVYVVGSLALLLALTYVWPNLIHEPLHLLALRLQGVEGTINFDWSSLPAHPTITRQGPLTSVAGGLFFVLLPSIVSVLLLSLLVMTAKHASVATHVVLPAYLAMDLAVNIMKFTNPTSDFYFLTAVNGGVVISLAVSIAAFLCAGFVASRVLRVREVAA